MTRFSRCSLAAAAVVALLVAQSVSGAGEDARSPLAAGLRGAQAHSADALAAALAAAPGARRLNDGAIQLPLVKRVQTGRDARRLAPDEEAPIYGAFKDLAYYYVDVYIGTPPRKFTVIADTGSSLLAVPCASCTSCGAHMDPKFDPSLSSTAVMTSCHPGCSTCHVNQCGYSQSYMEGSSLRGYYWTDTIWIGHDNSPASDENVYGLAGFEFGCHSYENGMFTSQKADGIMGMSRSSRTLISHLAAAHKIHANAFSMCLAMTGGVITLGDVDTRTHTAPIQWVPLSTLSTDYYNVQIHSFQVGDSTASSYQHGAIIDSGTSFTYVGSTVYPSVLSAITSFCARSGNCLGTKTHISGEDLCYRLSHSADIATFPSVTINVGGVDVVMAPEHVFMGMSWDSGAYCLGLYKNNARSSVVGANAMQGHDFIFNNEQHRVGIAPARCVMPATPPTDSSGGGSASGSAASSGGSSGQASSSSSGAATSASGGSSGSDSGSTTTVDSRTGSHGGTPLGQETTADGSGSDVADHTGGGGLDGGAIVAIAVCSAGAAFACVIVGIVVAQRRELARGGAPQRLEEDGVDGDGVVLTAMPSAPDGDDVFTDSEGDGGDSDMDADAAAAGVSVGPPAGLAASVDGGGGEGEADAMAEPAEVLVKL